MDRLSRYLVFFIFSQLILSCGNLRKVTYFNDLPDTQIEYEVQQLEPVIQKNDLLNIMVNSMNGEANQLFNLYTISSNAGNVNAGTLTQTAGFLVDRDGNIQFPMIGKIKAAGLTKKQLKEEITKSLISNNILYDPVVNIRYLNYKVTVLGQVAHPSVINVPSEKITLLEALGLAGDITNFGERSNVLIIREEEEGKRITKHVDLNSNDLLQSPYYYLQSNDVVYVAPNKTNVANTNATRIWLPSVFSALSFIIILVDKLL